MCCFSRPVVRVSQTNIFARSGEHNRQVLAYSMRLEAREDLAMILPIPVARGSGERAVRFIDLKKAPDLFTQLHLAFPPPQPPGRMGSYGAKATASLRPLPVIEVGNFEASFVPTVKDFGRLDPRFALPPATWDKLPAYRSYGFAVFKLKPGSKVIHPMAFEFPRADASKLFFPTVHIHDGKVHETAMFDHSLFCQKSPADRFPLAAWRESDLPARHYISAESTHGLVLPTSHLYMLTMRGRLRNADYWV